MAYDFNQRWKNVQNRIPSGHQRNSIFNEDKQAIGGGSPRTQPSWWWQQESHNRQPCALHHRSAWPHGCVHSLILAKTDKIFRDKARVELLLAEIQRFQRVTAGCRKSDRHEPAQMQRENNRLRTTELATGCQPCVFQLALGFLILTPLMMMDAWYYRVGPIF